MLFAKRKIFARYFVLYFVLFTFTLIVIATLLNFFILPGYVEKIRDNVRYKLEYLATYLDNSISVLERTAYILAYDNELAQNLNSQDASKVRDGIESLKTFVIQNDLLNGIILHYQDTDMLFTSEGTIHEQSLDHMSAQIKNMFAELAYNKSSKRISFAPSVSGVAGELLVGVICKKIRDEPKDIIIIFRISSNNLKKLPNMSFDIRQESFAIAYEKQTLLLSAGLFDFDAFFRELKVGTNGTFETNDVTVISRKSSYENIEYFLSLPKSYFLMDYARLQIIITVFLVLLALMGFAMSFYFAVLNCKPLFKLFEMLDKDISIEKKEAYNDFFKVLSSVIDNNKKLKEDLIFQKSFLKRHTLLTLLNDTFYTDVELRNICDNTNVVFNGRGFCVVLISGIPCSDDENDTAELVTQYLEIRSYGYVVEELNTNMLVVILSLQDTANWTDMRDSVISCIMNLINIVTADYICGDFHHTLSGIRDSYKEAYKHYISQKSIDEKHDTFISASKERDMYFEVLEYVNDNYIDPSLSIESVAEYIGKSKYYVSRLFKTNTTRPYIDYVSTLRLTHAKNLLTKTDMLVSEIVQKVGYINVPSFNKKFKSVFGVSPREYKKLNTN